MQKLERTAKDTMICKDPATFFQISGAASFLLFGAGCRPAVWLQAGRSLLVVFSWLAFRGGFVLLAATN